MHPTHARDEVSPSDEIQKLDGPDYVAVVVEWTDADEEAPTTTNARPFRPRPPFDRTLATVLGALGAIALTTWGLRLLKPA
jgi:hypothetical protein